MRIWHLVAAVFLVAVLLSLLSEPAGRVGVIVFLTASGEVFCGVVGVMTLFHTLGSLGHARDLGEAVQCLTATFVVMFLVSLVMATMFVIGAVLVIRVV